MQDNSTRGERTVFWLKALFVATIIFILSCIPLMTIDYESLQGVEDFSKHPEMAGFMVDFLIFLGVFLVYLLVFGIGATFWAMWMYRSEKNLRKFTKTAFSPCGAVFCTVLLSFVPVVGSILDYLIFKDLLDGHERVLSEKGIEYSPFDRHILVALLVLMILCEILWFFPSGAIYFVSVAVSFAVLVAAIKLVRGVVAYEKPLFAFDQADIIRRKVDEVLREREIEKAAAEVREAIFDSDAVPPADKTDR